MSKPFEWKDFQKRDNDLGTNNFPVLSKNKQVQDTIKFKVSSKAQKGVKFDTSVTNFDSTSTEADFSTKINLEEVKGIELGFKAKSKPSAEFTIKASDEIVPLPGASVTAKLAAAVPSDQSVGLSLNFANTFVNTNLGFSYPVSRRLFDFVENTDKLSKQQPKIDVDFVAKPLADKDLFLGGFASIAVPTEESPLTYDSKIVIGIDNKTINSGLYIQHTKEKEVHKNKFGAWAFTENADLSGGAHFLYSPDEEKAPFKGFSIEAIAAIQRDADSKLSSKVQIAPDPIVSLGYEQKLSPNVKLSLGYSFLLAKASAEKSKNSAFHIGLDLSH